jgi:hypothetical protein
MVRFVVSVLLSPSQARRVAADLVRTAQDAHYRRPPA